jgi:hypothetical protein
VNRKLVPNDSILHYWLDRLAITEIPVSYQIVCGLSLIGSLLKRNIFVDQSEWKVYPNMSVLLVGPSGIGKDIAINAATSVVDAVGAVPVIGGKTMDRVKHAMLNIGIPAACYVPAAELTAFLGGKDYQKSMVQELTDLLSTGEKTDVSTKSEGTKIIIQPTVTMQAGSTRDWLHRAMPDGSLEGGFLPRFVIVCEEYGSKFVPFVKYSTDRGERDQALRAKTIFTEEVGKLVKKYGNYSAEIIPTRAARDYYENWYRNRFSYFSPLVKPYANRSRDHLHRIAMLMAVSRGHSFLEEQDYVFGGEMVSYVASTIEKALRPDQRK